MPTDTERRKVAANLRDSAGNGEVLRDAFLEEILAGDTGLWFAEDIEIDTLLYHLADLIEPSESKVKCIAEVKIDGEKLEELVHNAVVELTGIDRDALLEEVNELEKCAYYFGLDFDEDEPLRDRLKEAAEDFAGCASRIRKALGVQDG